MYSELWLMYFVQNQSGTKLQQGFIWVLLLSQETVSKLILKTSHESNVSKLCCLCAVSLQAHFTT